MAIIKLDHVSKIYSNEGSSSIGIQDVSASFDVGEFVAITGESGSGKSTFLNVVSLLDSYEEGELFIDGKSAVEFTKEDFAKYQANYVSFVFQEYNVIDSFDCLTNVMLPLLAKGVSMKEAKDRALKALEEVGLKANAHQKTSKLSGGQKQRVVISRALVSDTPVLACDEPTGNLDSKTGKEIIDIFKRVSKNRLVFFVTHDYDQIKDVATRHLELSNGHIVKDETLKPKLEVNEPVVPDKGKTNFWHRVFLGAKDAIETPKKSGLCLLLALFSSLALLLDVFGCYEMVHSLGNNIVSVNRTYDSSLHTENRLLLTDTSDTPFSNLSLPSGAILDRASFFSKSEFLDLKIANNPNDQFTRDSNIANYGLVNTNDKPLYGVAPVAADEMALIIPSSQLSVRNDTYLKYYYFDMYQGYDLSINPFSYAPRSGSSFPFKLTGAYAPSWKDCNTLGIVFSHASLTAYMKQIDTFMTSGSVTDDDFITNSSFNPTVFYPNLTFTVNDVNINFTMPNSKTRELSLPFGLAGTDLILHNDGYSVQIPADKMTTNGYGAVCCSTLSLYPFLRDSSHFASIFFDTPAEAAAFAASIKDTTITSRKASVPSNTFTNTNYGNIFLIVIFVLLVVLIGIVLALIASLIFSIIYKSKAKDYAIYLTLAFSQGDIQWINLAETALYFIIASLLSIGLVFGIGSATANSVVWGTFFLEFTMVLSNPWIDIAYVLVSLLFAFAISFRNMKKFRAKTRAASLRKDDSLL